MEELRLRPGRSLDFLTVVGVMGQAYNFVHKFVLGATNVFLPHEGKLGRMKGRFYRQRIVCPRVFTFCLKIDEFW